MLKNIPSILSPELLKVLCETGHGDRICIGDGNFPGASIGRQGGCVFFRADGHGTPELLNAILEVFPLDSYTDTPAMLMQKMVCDKELDIPIWDMWNPSPAMTQGALRPWASMSGSGFMMRPRPATACSSPARPRYTQTSYFRKV